MARTRVHYRLFATGVALFASVLTLPLAQPAAAAGAVQVSGVQLVAVPCDSSAPVTYTMVGDLTGCWYADLTPIAQPPSGVLVATGTEHFVGCVAGRCGTLSFTYVFSGKYADPGVYTQELFGRCEHKVVAATGGLAGTTGAIHFKDDVVNVTAPYTGHLSFA